MKREIRSIEKNIWMTRCVKSMMINANGSQKLNGKKSKWKGG